MKPMAINGEMLNNDQSLVVGRWLLANGCRHYVPREARVIVTGTRIIVPTFDIERVGQKNKKWAQKKRDGKAYLPIKIRTYRLRAPLPQGVLQ